MQAHRKGGRAHILVPLVWCPHYMTLARSRPLSGLFVPLHNPTPKNGGGWEQQGARVHVSRSTSERQDGRASFLGAWTVLTE